MKTITTWKTGQAFHSTKDDHSIEVDGNGFNPKALLLTGLAACAGIDVVEILEKMRVPFASLSIETLTEQTEGTPRVFRDIHLNFIIKTDEGNRPKLVKAIELSLEKYCGVAAMLRKHSAIHYILTLEAE